MKLFDDKGYLRILSRIGWIKSHGDKREQGLCFLCVPESGIIIDKIHKEGEVSLFSH